MGFSLKKVVNSVAKVAGGALGFTASGGNPAGAVLGGNLADTVLGTVGLSSDQINSASNLSMQKDLAAYTAGKQNELNEAAYQRNLQQWNMENAYNSPAEQMKRYEAAGLNKNLIYGQQNTSGNSPTLQPATYDPGHYQPVDKSAQRQALYLAMMEHKQRIVNQAIENDLARQRLVLAARDADRSDMLARAQVQAIGANLGLTGARIDDINYRNSPENPKNQPFYLRLYNWAKDSSYNWFSDHIGSDGRIHSKSVAGSSWK